ncbi:ABC transporter ATP-binding protein/permease [Clostridium sp. MSJ-8]|uniref:ABC transporter ATP-binding protein n=1 Tax=Clostridium sp. MSJ-8 TaxID=2841510 RepID=UPI001C0EF530|nr:ABC transporter ATP-binding protein/permease [Clostridium sp. MSJ-8]
MLKMLKYMKKSTMSIIVIIALLIVQAVCDLSLPDYTSDIVNVGIQQGGIDEKIPEVIRRTEMKKVLMFLDDDDVKETLSYYKLVEKDKATKDQKKDYPILKSEDVYILKSLTDDDIEEAKKIMSKPMLAVYSLEQDSKEIKKMKKQIVSQIPGVSEDTDIFEVFSMLPEEQLATITDKITSNFDGMEESILEQSSVVYIKAEYEAIGIDTDKNQTNYIVTTGLKMVGLALIAMVASVLVGFLGARVAASLGKDLRDKVFRKVLSFSNTEMDKFSTASLITRTTNDIQQIQLLMAMVIRMVFYAPILGIGGIIKVLNTNVSMTWIIAFAVILISIVVGSLFVIAMPKFKAVQKLVDKLNLVTREILTGLPVIRAFSREKHEEERFEVANKNLTKVNLFVNRVMALMMPIMMFIMNGITILIVWRGAHSVDSGSMQVGDMMAFIQYAMQIIMAFLMIAGMSIMLPRASVSALRIEEVITTEEVIKDTTTPKKLQENKKGVLEFKNVSFKYPNADKDVISNISFTAKPGETTAIIGSTGAGKSTLINLIPRFYDVTEGEILFDGVDIRDITQHELRDKIGFVPQKGVLFSGTIDSNLRFGREEATKEQVKKASQIAQATEFIETKPEKFDTPISQGGTNVSGGQKQRLSIARAIVKDPELYVFDDSFSALDFKTDAALRKALKKETGNSTVLIVAQRISTILHAEQILVLDEGRIVGKGTHKELLQNCEVYKEIASSQLSKEELENE